MEEKRKSHVPVLVPYNVYHLRSQAMNLFTVPLFLSQLWVRVAGLELEKKHCAGLEGRARKSRHGAGSHAAEKDAFCSVI